MFIKQWNTKITKSVITEFVKTKITVPNANKKIKEIEDIQITEACGGDGAFREVVDCILN